MEEETINRNELIKESLPWVEKYRPNSLNDLIAHEDIISICNFF